MADEVDEPADDVAEGESVVEADKSGEPSEQRDSRAGWRTRRPLVVALALLVAALAFAGWSGWTWYAAAADDSLEYAQARDTALRAGREKLAVLTSMDYRHVDKGIQRWKQAATGSLHERLGDTGAGTKDALRKAGAVATGEVVAAGLTELDAHAGSATMIASVKITIDKNNAPTTSKRNRFVAELHRTEQGWKLSNLNTVPLSGA